MPYHDFILLKAHSDTVLEVLVSEIRQMNEPQVHFGAAPSSFGIRLLSKVLRKTSRRAATMMDAIDELIPQNSTENAEDMPQTEWSLHRGPAAEAGSILTWDGGAQVFASLDVRVSALTDRPEWVLVEHCDQISGMATKAFGLSMQIPDTEVYFFRRTVGDENAPRCEFYVYRGGENERRVMSNFNYLEQQPDESYWEAYADGLPHALEEGLDYEGLHESDVMTPERQDVILARLGVRYDSLFHARSVVDPVLISEKPGGAPLTSVAEIDRYDPLEGMEVRPVGPMEMMGEFIADLRKGLDEARDRDDLTPEQREELAKHTRNLDQAERMERISDFAMTGGGAPDRYQTRADAMRGLARLLIECDIDREDVAAWLNRLIQNYETTDWDATYESVAELVIAAPIEHGRQSMMMSEVDAILTVLSGQARVG